VFTTLETFAPRLADKFKQATSFSGQRSDRPARGDSTLYAPRPGDGRERGTYPGARPHVEHVHRGRAQPGGHGARRRGARARRRPRGPRPRPRLGPGADARGAAVCKRRRGRRLRQYDPYDPYDRAAGLRAARPTRTFRSTSMTRY
jgi:hypothetical protein